MTWRGAVRALILCRMAVCFSAAVGDHDLTADSGRAESGADEGDCAIRLFLSVVDAHADVPVNAAKGKGHDRAALFIWLSILNPFEGASTL